MAMVKEGSKGVRLRPRRLSPLTTRRLPLCLDDHCCAQRLTLCCSLGAVRGGRGA